MRNIILQENRARYCQEIQELRRICCEETDRARQLRNHKFLDRRKRFFTILGQRAALEHPTQPILEVCLTATLDC